jgi:LEA14-like dessication related protein
MKKIYIVVVAIIIIVLVVSGYIAKKQFSKIMNYCYKFNIKKSKINKISSSVIDMSLAVDFKNNSDIDFLIDGYNIDVLLNDNKVSTVSSKDSLTLKSKSFTTMVIPVNIDLGGMNAIPLASVIGYIITDKSKVNITVKGNISGGALGVKVKDFPIELTLNLAELMKPTSEPQQVCK